MTAMRAPGRHSRRRFIALGVGACGAGLVIACTGTSSGAGGPGLALEPRPKFSGRRPAPGVLRLGRLPDTASTTVTSGSGAAIDVDHVLLSHARLVAVDPRGPSIYPDAAIAIEVPDAQTVRFTLRDGQRFHPGGNGTVQPLSADTVRTDFQRRAAERQTLFAEVIDRLDRPDSRTLVLHLKAPFGLLFELLGGPSASLRGDGTYAGTEDRVGSGAWVPAQRETGVMRYTANPALSGDLKPLLHSVEIASASVASELDAAFARGDIDVRVHPAGTVPPADQSRGVSALKRPSRRMRGLGLSLLGLKNGANVRSIPAFQDHRVRRAIAMSLNREALLALDGSYTSGPVGPSHAGDALPEADLRAHQIYRYEPAEARKLLAAANQDALAFRLALPDLPLMLQWAQIVAENLQAVGFQPRLQNLPFDGWQKSFLAGDFEATLFELGALDTPDVGLRLHTTEGVGGRFSLWGYSNPAYDVAVRAALSAFDPKVRAEKSREAQRLLLDDAPAMLPLGTSAEFASIGPGITGYDFAAYEMNTGYLSSMWVAPQRA